jgi:TonB family protein
VGTGEGPFPGITIADGTDGPKAPVAGSSDSRTARNTPDNSKYGLTVMATGTSGGGLKDYGVFRNESVYTVYIELEHSSRPAPAWILQYARLRPAPADPVPAGSTTTTLKSVQMEAPVQAPFPVEKPYPQFPADILARNPGRMVVVYAVINAEGVPEQVRIVQSPNPLLNQPVLEALRKWSFRPAEMNGQAVAVKSLLGIPLPITP